MVLSLRQNNFVLVQGTVLNANVLLRFYSLRRSFQFTTALKIVHATYRTAKPSNSYFSSMRESSSLGFFRWLFLGSRIIGAINTQSVAHWSLLGWRRWWWRNCCGWILHEELPLFDHGIIGATSIRMAACYAFSWVALPLLAQGVIDFSSG
jgi:hypothetical protein